jgi:hypothetical protein
MSVFKRFIGDKFLTGFNGLFFLNMLKSLLRDNFYLLYNKLRLT